MGLKCVLVLHMPQNGLLSFITGCRKRVFDALQMQAAASGFKNEGLAFLHCIRDLFRCFLTV